MTKSSPFALDDGPEAATSQDKPVISVVLPAFNAAAFIDQALDSVSRQTHSSYEIVVVDDGSEDDTIQRVAAWGGRNPGVPLRLMEQGHQGISAARNAGVREAIADFVAFLDADDIWEDRKLEVVAKSLNRPSPADLICHDEWLEEQGCRKGRLTHGPYTTYEDLLFKGNCVSTSAVVVRRSRVLEVGGFAVHLKGGVEDYDLWLRLARAGCRFEYVHEALGVYRRMGQGISSRIVQHCEEGLDVLASHYSEWKRKTPYYRYLIRQRRSAVLRGACRSFMQRGDHRGAQQFLRRALAEDPFSWKTWVLGVLNLAQARI